jgi:hypothetical protein
MRYVYAFCVVALVTASVQGGDTGRAASLKVRPGTGKIAAVQQSTVEVQADSGERLSANFGNEAKDMLVGQTAWIDGNAIRVVDFPIEMENKDKVGGGDYMETKVKVSNTGLLTAKTKTWTTACADGFTGGVRVILMKKDGNELYITKLHKYGVNGTCVPSAPSSRNESWDETIPLDKIKDTAKLAIVHIKKPTDRVDDFLARAKEVAEIAKTLSEAYKNASGGPGQPAPGGKPGGVQ